MDFSRQAYWSGYPFPSPENHPDPGVKPVSPAFQADSLPSQPPGNYISSVQSLGCVLLFATPWTAACQAFLSVSISWSLLKLMFIQSVMPSNHLIFCHLLLFLLSIFPSIRIFSSELALRIRGSKYWSFGFSISPSS